MSSLSSYYRDAAAENWNLTQLFTDLGNIKIKYFLKRETKKPPFEALTPVEKDFFYVLLYGEGLKEIAQEINWQYSSVQQQMRKYVYNYVEELLNEHLHLENKELNLELINLEDNGIRITKYSDVYHLLKQAGYQRVQDLDLAIRMPIDHERIQEIIDDIRSSNINEKTKNLLIGLLIGVGKRYAQNRTRC